MINSQWTIDTKHLPKEENEKQPETKYVPVKKAIKKIVSTNNSSSVSAVDFNAILKGIIKSTTEHITISNKVLEQSYSPQQTVDMCKKYGIDPSDVKSIVVTVDKQTNFHKITIEKFVY